MTYEWLAIYDRFNALSQWGEFLVENGKWKYDEPIKVPWLARAVTPTGDQKSGWLREPLMQNRDFLVDYPEPKTESFVTVLSQEKMKPHRNKLTGPSQHLTISFEVPKKAIDRKRVKSIVLMEQNPDVPPIERRPVLVAHIPEGGRFILYTRVYRKTDAETGADVGEPIPVWCLGVQSNIRGKNSQYVNLLWPDGRVETVDRFIEDHQYFHPRGDYVEGKFVPKVHSHEGEEWDFSA